MTSGSINGLTINWDEWILKYKLLHWQVLHDDETFIPQPPNGNVEIETDASPVELILQFVSEEFLELRVEAEVTYPTPLSGEETLA